MQFNSLREIEIKDRKVINVIDERCDNKNEIVRDKCVKLMLKVGEC